MVDCGKYQGSLREAWLDGAFYEAVVCPYDAAMGELAFGLVIYSALTFGLYIRTGSAAVPTVVTIVAGSVAISRLPSQAAQAVALALMLVLSAGGYLIYQRVQTSV